MMICVAFGGGGGGVSVVSVLCGAGGGLTVQPATHQHQRGYRGDDANGGSRHATQGKGLRRGEGVAMSSARCFRLSAC